MRENLIVHVKDRAAFCVDYLFVNVFFCSQTGVFVVLYCLQINQSKRKSAEEHDKSSANQGTAASAIRVHLVPEGLATGRIASSPTDRAGIVSRTMLFSETGTIFK